jgi:hypothetical protein
MKLIVRRKQLSENPEMWLRSAGYVMINDRLSGQLSYARRLARDFYPRFHLYFTVEKDGKGVEFVIFNLHLDQKQPGYEGQNRHNAEYDGELVAQEFARLKNLVLPDFFV